MSNTRQGTRFVVSAPDALWYQLSFGKPTSEKQMQKHKNAQKIKMQEVDIFCVLASSWDECDSDSSDTPERSPDAIIEDSLLDSEEHNQGNCAATSFSDAAAKAPSAAVKKRRKTKPSVPRRDHGGFRHRIRKRFVLTKKGKLKHVASGQDPIVIPMDDQRKQKVIALMARNKNFSDAVNVDDVRVMVDHFTMLMILTHAYVRNGQGKGDKYPRYLKIFFEPGGFTRRDEVVESNQKKARELALQHVLKNVIHKQNIKIGANKVNAMQAPENKRNALVQTLVKNFMFGFNTYAQLLSDVNTGKLVVPDWCVQKAAPKQEDWSFLAKGVTPVCSPSSPCRCGQ